MKKVLIITYYWPPVNSAGVYRWLKFVKYLREFNWEPVVYTIERKSQEHSSGLSNDIPEGVTVLTRPIFDPFDVYQAFVRKNKKNAQPGFINEQGTSSASRKLLFWIRGNFFIPDAKKFWIKPSIRYLCKYIQQNDIDVVVSTGPPHSMHLIGHGLKKELGIKWLADFRDPWTNIDFYERLNLSKSADRKHHALERSVVSNANEVTTVSWSLAKELGQDQGRKIHVLTNGYDEQDYQNIEQLRSDKFTIVQTGSMNEDRNPHALWDALNILFSKVKGSRDSVRVKLIGSVDHFVVSSFKKAGLEDIVELHGLMAHNKAIEEMVNATLLLLPINDSKNKSGIVPGKFYEYLRSGTRVLCIGPPDGDAAKIIKETNCGTVHDHNDVDGVFTVLETLFKEHQTTGVTSTTANYSKYDRKNLTGELAELLNGL